MSRFYIIVMALVAFTTACASAGGQKAGTAGVQSGSPTSTGAAEVDPNRITAAEITNADLPNAYELVSRLRRPWLRRDPRTGNAVSVYMDEQNIGGASKLREIPAVEVGELQFVPYDDAVKRWGSAVKGSVIVVIRRR